MDAYNTVHSPSNSAFIVVEGLLKKSLNYRALATAIILLLPLAFCLLLYYWETEFFILFGDGDALHYQMY